jgi:hypothetical protein
VSRITDLLLLGEPGEVKEEGSPDGVRTHIHDSMSVDVTADDILRMRDELAAVTERWFDFPYAPWLGYVIPVIFLDVP